LIARKAALIAHGGLNEPHCRLEAGGPRRR
jgi:hypothetical protein